MAYTDDDLQEALRQKYRNKSLDLGVDRLESMDLSRVNVPDTVEDFVGQLYRGAEGVPAIPDDVPADERASQGWRDIGMALLSDKSPAPGDDSIQESWDIMDIFPPEGMASMGAAGAKALAAKGMALKGVGMMAPALAAGEIKGVIQGGLPARLAAEEKLMEYAKRGELPESVMIALNRAMNNVRTPLPLGEPEYTAFQRAAYDSSNKRREQIRDIMRAQNAVSDAKTREKAIEEARAFKQHWANTPTERWIPGPGPKGIKGKPNIMRAVK